MGEAEEVAMTRQVGGVRVRPEYDVWRGMVDRCENPRATSYPYYGARGITVDPRWKESFWVFLADVGPRPSMGHTLDRKDRTGPYAPGNVRWATPKEQAGNRGSLETTFECLRCGHRWHPSKPELPLRCASCKNPYWNRQRIYKARRKARRSRAQSE